MYEDALTEAGAREICSWRYPAPYDVYDLPAWEEAAARGWGIGRADVREREFFAIRSEKRLIGYFRLKDCGEYIMLGMGLAPEECGRGLGRGAMLLALDRAAERHAGVPVRLEVRAFNGRAIRCYERAGFREIGRRRMNTPTGEAEAVLMEYCPSVFPLND